MEAPGRWECELFSLSCAFAARVAAQGRAERHDRTTLVKRRMACAILVLGGQRSRESGRSGRLAAKRGRMDNVPLPFRCHSTASQADKMTGREQSRH